MRAAGRWGTQGQAVSAWSRRLGRMETVRERFPGKTVLQSVAQEDR
jgi:hypothetical protein